MIEPCGPFLARLPELCDLPDGSVVYRPRSPDVVGAVFDRELVDAGLLSARSHLLRSAGTAFIVWPDESRGSPLSRLGVRVDARSRPPLADLAVTAAEPFHIDAKCIVDWAAKVLRVFDAGWCGEPGPLDGIVALAGESMRRTLMLLRRSVTANDYDGASVAIAWLGWAPEVSATRRAG